jgi:ankyrin repeat protein
MDKMKRLLDQPGIPLNQLTPRGKKDRYICPLTLVSRAVQRGNLEMVKLLIGKGADVDARAPEGLNALAVAAEYGDQAIVQALLEAGAHVNGSPTTDTAADVPINLAGRYGNVPMLQELLKSDQLDINKQDSEGRGGIHFLVHAYEYAAGNHGKEKALLEIMKDMISKKVDVNKQDGSGSTPLHWAVMYEVSSEVFKLLLNVPNIQVNVQDQDGCTPLHHLVANYLYAKDPVVLSSLSQTIFLLIQHRARIDLKSKPWNERREVYYTDKEREKLLKDQAGKSVIEVAQESGNDALIKLLKGEAS